MAQQIIDGKGGSNVVEVDSNHMLMTNSLQMPRILWHSVNGSTVFTTYNKHTIQVDDTEEKICYLKYTGNSYLVMNKFMVSCNNVSYPCKFEIYVDPITVAGGVEVVPTNWNLDSSNSIDTTTLHTSGGSVPITTVSDGTEILCFYSKATEGLIEVNLDGLVLGKGDSILIIAENKAGSKVRCTLHYYEE